MISSIPQTNSEAALMESIHTLSQSGCAVIQIRTREPFRAAQVIRKSMVADAESIRYIEWDIVNGKRDNFGPTNLSDITLGGVSADFMDAMPGILVDIRSASSRIRQETDKTHFFCFVTPEPFIRDNPVAAAYITQYADLLPTTNVCILFVTGEEPLPGIPPGAVLTSEFYTPTVEELKVSLRRLIEESLKEDEAFPKGSDLEEDDLDRICHMGAGLTLFEFETHVAITLCTAANEEVQAVTLPLLLNGVMQGKVAVVKQSEILELLPAGDIGEVGGMQRLKDWVSARQNAYSDEAREFGIEPPKGAALVGVPGTGKSLVAKAVASIYAVPLVRLDFARVFSKYVGDSETRVRAALKMVEAMAPCVLFVDEIDKGLGGAGGGGDSGTSSRVLGSFLTWLQETKAPVFTMVTANRVEGLPPELLRRGRFDQIFSVAMPNAASREEVLGIHLSKRGRKLSDFTKTELQDFREASEGYVPAEIESAVKDALIAAYSSEGKVLKMDHIKAALKEMIPMSKANAAAIARIVEWADSHAISVEYKEGEGPKAGQATPFATRGRVYRPGARRKGA